MWISTSLKYNTVQALWPRAVASSYLMLVVSVYWTAISWEFEPCSRAPWKRERDLGNKTKNFQYWLYVICHLDSFGSYCRLRIYLMQSYKTFQAFSTKFTERMRKFSPTNLSFMTELYKYNWACNNFHLSKIIMLQVFKK